MHSPSAYNKLAWTVAGGRWSPLETNMGKLYMHWAPGRGDPEALRPELGHCPMAVASTLRVLPWAAGPARQQPCPVMAVEGWAALLTQGTLCASLSGAFV